jgi:hypothetical protein
MAMMTVAAHARETSKPAQKGSDETLNCFDPDLVGALDAAFGG